MSSIVWHKKKPSIFCNRAYSSYPVLANFKKKGVFVLITERDSDSTTNINDPFLFNDNKEKPCKIVCYKFKQKFRAQRRDVMVISGRGWALESSAVSGEEGIVTIARRNDGQAAIYITVLFSGELLNDSKLTRCSFKTVVIQKQISKSERKNPGSVERGLHTFDELKKVRKCLDCDFFQGCDWEASN